ncbi:hypothetical protein OSCT_1682 [Oscillochloris trichoides DG-6]|uniref:Glycosyltransferase n=1 Tax=Oscillochloris trichoides DG-6 TaxID=765420 RepID=E1IED1_9CHLR|nr:TIGR04282 family arsenosugar biosynthesis glycosyltransferase [Oscillochloris trichoides]EFO80457.1 hypothetical protein OSCT_1682 [Oscillochloris trichoides DG-6]
MQPNALFVVAKRPLAGYTKTRLYPPLNPQTAVLLYEGFLRDTLELMRQVPNVRRGIAFLPHDAENYFREIAPDMDLIPQRGNNLGERLDHLLTDALQAGTPCAVVVNSDSPTLPLTYFHLAFDYLNAGADLVLGPCDDGGYYLIGLRQPQPRLLRDVTMSTPTVLQDTLAIAAELGLQSKLLPIWYDVDTVTELSRLQRELANTDPRIAPHTRRFLNQML